MEHCGTYMAQLKGGGCGGGGAVYGCGICEKVFIQLSGGLVQTPLVLEELEGKTVTDFKEKDKIEMA